MSLREDQFYEIYNIIDKNGIKDQFDKQLAKMKNQRKHSKKDTLELWEYASNKVIQNHKLSNNT
jgi:hypothetical protein